MNEYRWDDMALGLKAEFDASFTAAMMQEFATLSGDVNPLHVDAKYARSQGFDDAVVFGLLVSSLYSRLVGVYLPGKYALLQGIDIDFNVPSFPGQILRVEGEVSYLNEAYHRFEVRARIRNAERRTVSKATIRVGFHGETPSV